MLDEAAAIGGGGIPPSGRNFLAFAHSALSTSYGLALPAESAEESEFAWRDLPSAA